MTLLYSSGFLRHADFSRYSTVRVCLLFYFSSICCHDLISKENVWLRKAEAHLKIHLLKIFKEYIKLGNDFSQNIEQNWSNGCFVF